MPARTEVRIKKEETGMTEDFTIEDGVLKKYNGTAADVVIPESVTVIGEKAFSFCANNLTIHAPAGSYAEQYAKEHNIPFVSE